MSEPQVYNGPNGGIHETLGDHGARIGRIEKDVHEMRKDVRRILDSLSQFHGAKRLLAVMFSIAGALGGAVGYAASFLK